MASAGRGAARTKLKASIMYLQTQIDNSKREFGVAAFDLMCGKDMRDGGMQETALPRSLPPPGMHCARCPYELILVF